jgi:hypothetical protein
MGFSYPEDDSMTPMFSRREMLIRTGCGFGGLALAGLLHEQSRAENAQSSGLPVRAKHVIFVLLSGGPSHMDMFDYKPELIRRAGMRYEVARGADVRVQGTSGVLLPPVAKFARHGTSGLWISDALPHLARVADRLCLINSGHGDTADHRQGLSSLFTGSFQTLLPSIGSWMLYGLGTANRNVPAFININPTGNTAGRDLDSAFLPASTQGTPIRRSGGDAIRYLRNPSFSSETQQRQLSILRRMRERDLAAGEINPTHEAMIESFELAFRMQTAVPEVLDLSRETAATQAKYGIGPSMPGLSIARDCLIARRCVEAGIRYVQINGLLWDHHDNIATVLPNSCQTIDQPVAALIDDLHQRGKLQETLIVMAGEIGRLPFAAGNGSRGGRDHNGSAMTFLLAGGGIKGGMHFGATDEIGLAAVENKVHIHDLHATIFHLLGIDHERFFYETGGRQYKINDGKGRVVRDVIA